MSKEQQKLPWKIHYVTNSDDVRDWQDVPQVFFDGMCDAHTHGLNKFGSLELQIVLDLGPEVIGVMLNLLASAIVSGDFVPEENMQIDGLIPKMVVRVNKAKDAEDNDVWRIVFPDNEGNFPENTEYMPWRMQLGTPCMEVATAMM